MHQVSHFIGLKGIGGVQRNFIEYLVGTLMPTKKIY